MNIGPSANMRANAGGRLPILPAIGWGRMGVEKGGPTKRPDPQPMCSFCAALSAYRGRSASEWKP